MNFQEQYGNYLNRLDVLKAKHTKLKNDLNSAYAYKENIISKMQFADKQIEDKQQEFHELLLEIQTEITNIKIAFDEEAHKLGVS
jgi:hypothetical protein